MKLLTPILTLSLLFGAAQAGNNDYRDYLKSIDGVDLWFRVGSYSIEADGVVTPIDIYYYDSDARPDGKPLNGWFYPNAFGLFCVWQDKIGNWKHKEVAGAARCTFNRIVSVKSDHIELELRPKFRIIIGDDDDFNEQWKRIEEINKPFKRILSFKDGVPVLNEPEQNKAEQGDAANPTPR